ncbi:hypothetical protein K438DRAFT_653681 [Mycena galopus ATCC 62051]|nr:hypothetical protein K438DRAFT_653681 [Mycena galopus ATCC 62051]
MALRALLPWNWGTAHSGHEKELGSGNGTGTGTGKNSNGIRVRTRAEQVAESKRGKKTRAGDADAHFPGLVNMSGTHCLMNSTLQVCAGFEAFFENRSPRWPRNPHGRTLGGLVERRLLLLVCRLRLGSFDSPVSALYSAWANPRWRILDSGAALGLNSLWMDSPSLAGEGARA